MQVQIAKCFKLLDLINYFILSNKGFSHKKPNVHERKVLADNKKRTACTRGIELVRDKTRGTSMWAGYQTIRPS